MERQSITRYPYHLCFLKDFPELKSMLDCGGYTLVHSHQDFRMRVLYTFWDNHSSEAEKTQRNDATSSIMVAYCQQCKTVEIFDRVLITKASREKGDVTTLMATANEADETLNSADAAVPCQYQDEELDRLSDPTGN